MSNKPEHIKCIQDNYTDSEKMTWCGRKMNPFEFTFLDIEHAAFSGRNGAYLTACGECVQEIIKALKN